jgi:hypothetical protein
VFYQAGQFPGGGGRAERPRRQRRRARAEKLLS